METDDEDGNNGQQLDDLELTDDIPYEDHELCFRKAEGSQEYSAAAVNAYLSVHSLPESTKRHTEVLHAIMSEAEEVFKKKQRLE